MITIMRNISEVSTPAIAVEELSKLEDMAIDVQIPLNRRRLNLRRRDLNAHFDRLLYKVNSRAMDNTPDKDEWITIAEAVRKKREELSKIKEAVQALDLNLY
tara:strand:+ start:948 stop:1253 length:306 start_codon:yes stop_codon:yes gene_type:complete